MQDTPLEKDREEFLEWLIRLGYAKKTIECYSKLLKHLIRWLKGQEIESLEAVNQSLLKEFQADLETRRNKKYQGGLSGSYIESHLNILSLLNSYLLNYNRKPILEEKLKTSPFIKGTREALTQAEIKELYKATDDSLLGYRDRAVLAIYYGCGLRRTEGIELERRDINYSQGLLHVRKGKGRSTRRVPMSEQVQVYLKEYERYARPYLKPEDETFLISHRGKKLAIGSCLNRRLQQLVKETTITKPITLHVLRHSIATHLLEQGMKLEYIRHFLGHKTLDSTQVYAHLEKKQDEHL